MFPIYSIQFHEQPPSPGQLGTSKTIRMRIELTGVRVSFFGKPQFQWIPERFLQQVFFRYVQNFEKKSTKKAWLHCEKESFCSICSRSPISPDLGSPGPRKSCEKNWEQPCCLVLPEHWIYEKTRVNHSDAPHKRQTIVTGSWFQDTP